MSDVGLMERSEAPTQTLQPKRLEGLDAASVSATWGPVKDKVLNKTFQGTNVHGKSLGNGDFQWGGPDGSGADTDVSFAIHSKPFGEMVKQIQANPDALLPPSLIGSVDVRSGSREQAEMYALQHNAAVIKEFMAKGGKSNQLPETTLMPDIDRLRENNEVVLASKDEDTSQNAIEGAPQRKMLEGSPHKFQPEYFEGLNNFVQTTDSTGENPIVYASFDSDGSIDWNEPDADEKGKSDLGFKVSLLSSSPEKTADEKEGEAKAKDVLVLIKELTIQSLEGMANQPEYILRTLQHNAKTILEYLDRGGDRSLLPEENPLIPNIDLLLSSNKVVPNKAS
jgi:hypothetical protein